MNILQTYQVNPEKIHNRAFTPHVQRNLMHPININSTLSAITGAGRSTGQSIDSNANSAMNSMRYVNSEARKSREEKRRENLAQIQQTSSQNELERQMKLQKAIDSGDSAEVSRLDPNLGEQYAKTKDLENKNRVNQAYMDEVTGKPIALDAEGMQGMDNDEVLARIDAEKEQRAGLAKMSPFAEKARSNLGKMSKAKREDEEHQAKNIYGIMGGMEGIEDPKRREQVWDNKRAEIKEYFKGSGMFESEDYDADAVTFGRGVIADTFSGFNKKESGPLVEVNVPDSSKTIKSIYDAQQGEFEKRQAGEEGKQAASFEVELNNDLQIAQETSYKAERMMNLVNKKDMRTGNLIQFEQGIRSALTSFGLEGAERADTEELIRIGNSFVINELAKFKGATSEKELAFSRSLVGDITSGKESIRRYSLVQQGLANRAKAKANLYYEYIEGNDGKGTSRGFQREWLKYQTKNEIFPKIQNDADYESLASGAIFRDANDKIRKK